MLEFHSGGCTMQNIEENLEISQTDLKAHYY